MGLIRQYLNSIFRHPRQSFAERPWTTYSIVVEPFTLHLQLPTGESRDWPPDPVIERVDPADPSIYDKQGWRSLLEKYWDDPKVGSSLIAGTVKVSVSLRRVPADAPEEVTQLDGLAKYLDRTIRESYRRHNEEFVELKKRDPGAVLLKTLEPPRAYDPVEIGGRPWLALDWPSEPGLFVYAMPVSRRAHLRMYVTRISEGPRKADWTADIVALRDEILARLKVQERARAAVNLSI